MGNTNINLRTKTQFNMKSVHLIFLSASLGLVFLACGGSAPGEGRNAGALDTSGVDHSEPATLVYACPMHAEVIGNKGDTCPKCGMDLEEQK